MDKHGLSTSTMSVILRTFAFVNASVHAGTSIVHMMEDDDGFMK